MNEEPLLVSELRKKNDDLRFVSHDPHTGTTIIEVLMEEEEELLPEEREKYINVFPDQELGNFSFLIFEDPQTIDSTLNLT